NDPTFGSTVNVFAVVVVPPAFVTAIGPVTAPAGTVTFNCPATSTNPAGTPPTFTDDVPVNDFPVTVTTVPVKPWVGANDSSTLARRQRGIPRHLRQHLQRRRRHERRRRPHRQLDHTRRRARRHRKLHTVRRRPRHTRSSNPIHRHHPRLTRTTKPRTRQRHQT